ncbi:hypothetical protein [Archangium lipolyticum]|uniref:hypothetical protein n=1 Tax=Archangium lipolyticum TaxID=2970465 RepID=UPI00214A6130|nr:hypothetical protein [Archangium lipolyticum]
MPRKPQSSFVAEALEVYDVKPETEAKVLAADLKKRLADLGQLLPGKAVPSETMVRAVFEHCGELMELAREAASRSGIDTDEKVTVEGEAIPAHDYSFKTYDQFLKAEDEIEASVPKREGFAAGGADTAWTVVKKILGAIGIPAQHVGSVKAVLQEMAGNDLATLVRELKARRFSQARAPLMKILNVMRSKTFLSKLGKRIGAKAAGTLVAKIGAKFVPFVGWAVLAGQLIWAFSKQIF